LAAARLYPTADAQRAQLAITGLPRLQPDRTYQLWFARPGRPTETGGAFRVDERGQALVPIVIPVPLDQVSAIAVTEEPMPASLRPTGQHLLDGRP
jgi:Anti-sigma-K factor rskA, C-terminal